MLLFALVVWVSAYERVFDLTVSVYTEEVPLLATHTVHKYNFDINKAILEYQKDINQMVKIVP